MQDAVNLTLSTNFTIIVQNAMEATTTFVCHVIDQVLDAYTGLDLAMQLSPNSIGWKSLENSPRVQRTRICSEPAVSFHPSQRPVEQMDEKL